MENTPQLPDSDPDAKKAKASRKKKQKNAGLLGGFAVQPSKERTANEADSSNESTADILQKLKLVRRKGGISEAPQPIVHLPETNSGEQPENQEADESLDTLSSEEERFVERELIAARVNEPLDEQADHENNEETEVTAISAIELFREKIVHEGLDADTAFNEVLESLQADIDEANDAETEPLPGPMLIDKQLDAREFHVAMHRHEDPALAATGEDFSVVPPTSLAVPTGRHSIPAPHQSRSQPRSHSSLHPRATPIQPKGIGLYRLNAAASGSPLPKVEHMPAYDEINLKNIPGAIVGYLIGRRRGRIKTEKKLSSVKKSLEKKVQEVEGTLAKKEAQIQKMVHERTHEHRELTEHDEPVKSAGNEGRTDDRNETAIDATPAAKRAVAPEAHQLHGKALPPERIGHVLISSEAEPASLVESVMKESSGEPPKKEHEDMSKAMLKEESEKPARSTKEADSHRAATMSRSELLKLSEQVKVNDTTLRRIYETHLIGESGLRRLVYEYMQGGSVKEALQHEITEHETEYERDPQLRHRIVTDRGGSAPAVTADDANLNELLKRAATDKDSVRTGRPASAASPKIEHTMKESEGRMRQFRALDVAFTTVILVLVALVIMLIITRG